MIDPRASTIKQSWPHGMSAVVRWIKFSLQGRAANGILEATNLDAINPAAEDALHCSETSRRDITGRGLFE
jgi:hypothetical protein